MTASSPAASAPAAEADPSFAVELPPQPYPGLRPFEASEWPIFFGRERMCDVVIARLLEQQLLVVHGDSGCGKSSLIRAGVLPRFRQGAALCGGRWRTSSSTPGDAPLWNLARALAMIDGRGSDEGRVVELRRILNFGRDAAAPLALALRRDADDHVCVLIDQFEELFAHARRSGPQEASLMVELLMGIKQAALPGLHAVVTMRSEFLGACAQFGGFAETVNTTQYLLPRMAHADLVRAIREPALLYEGEISLELAERLIADAGGTQDQLPVIQHGLMLLHRDHVLRRPGAAAKASASGPLWCLTLDHYRTRDRGLAGLLSNHADEVMDSAQASKGEKSRTAEDLFRALTDINADGQAVRRAQKLRDLVDVTGVPSSSLRRIVDAFRKDGVSFLRPYGEGPVADDDYVDISHEALIRCWTRIADPRDGWLAREFKNGLVWRSLLVQADSFDRDSSNVLSPATAEERSVWMQRRNEAWASRYGGGWDRVKRLIETSVAESGRRQREQDEERGRAERAALREHELQAKARSLRIFRGGFALVVVLAAFVALLADDAVRARKTAEASAADARVQVNVAQNALKEEQKARALAEEKREVAQKSVNALTKTLSELNDLAGLLANVSHGETGEEITNLQQSIRTSIEQELHSLSAAARFTPRIYFQIADDRQRDAARRLKQRLEQLWTGDDAISVPGIEAVAYSGRAELRCFGTNECALEGPQLVAAINAQLISPKVRLQDLSARYPNVRARQYELWLGPGTLTFAPAKSKSSAQD